MIDEIEHIKNRNKNKRKTYFNQESYEKSNKFIYLKKLLSRSLISIILVLISLIYINYSDKNLLKYKENIFGYNLSFAKFNNWYNKYFGKIIPLDIKEENTLTVFNEELIYKNIEKYQNGYKLTVDSGTIIKNITSGIVVYMGEKDGYENVLIVQGIDGVDIWYGNVTNSNLTLYDYIEKGTILGESDGDYLYVLLNKSGEYLEYEKYIKENKY